MNLDRLLFPIPPATPAAGNCQLHADTAVLDALWLEGRKDYPVLLYSHGNYETLQDIRPLCQEFRLQGYGVFAYDYAGYGA
ncbi:MAG TPA: alpha/beta hydrolase, partial [Lentisphaeria bacterium]|nr:alpha/beta hydrolase [Lentisphaeria bacterium]